MAVDSITQIKNDNTADDYISSADWNNIVKFMGEGLARLIAKTMLSDGIITREDNPLCVDDATGRFLCPSSGEVVAGFIGGQMFWMDDTMEMVSTATGGNTVTLVDTSFTQVDDFWKYAWLICTSGTNNGLVRQITGFDATTGTLSWSSPLTAAVTAGDTYVVTFYYIQGLTDNDDNYIYGRALAITPEGFIIQWVSNTTGVKAAGDIYVADLTLTSGVVSLYNDSPAGSDRVLYPGVGSHDVETLTGTISNLAAGGTTELTLSHEYLLYRGGITVTLSNANFTYTVDEYYKPDEVVISVTNSAGYTDSTTYTVEIAGRQRRYFD